MIGINDISIVVQGAADKTETPKCLTSIRQYLPNAEIILSTWEGTDLSCIEGLYDKLVLSKDPGGVFYEKKKYYQNINRQIVSTKAGLELAERKFIMKLRSDLIFTNNTFLEYFEKFNQRIDEYKLFEHKILVPATFTRFQYKQNSIKTPFHVSDWWYLGLNQDIKKFFNAIEPVKEPNFSKYFEFYKDLKSPLEGYPTRYVPEQYFCLKAFGKYFLDIHMENLLDVNDDICKKSDIAIINNFIVLEFKQHGIYTNKYPQSKDEKILGEYYCSLYNNIVYQSEYKRLIDKDYLFTERELEHLNSKSNIKFLKLHKYISLTKQKKVSFSKKIEKIFLSIPLTGIDAIITFFFEKITGRI